MMARFGRRHPWFALDKGRLAYRGTIGLEGSVPDAEARSNAPAVTIQLLLGLKRMAGAAGASLFVVRLSDVGDDAPLLAALASASVPVVDVSAAEGGRLPFDFHPDAAWHADGARLLASTPALAGLGLSRSPGPARR